MNKALILFLEKIEDEAVIRFIFNHLTKSEVEQLFDLLRYCDSKAEERWQNTYSKMFTWGENKQE